jgi:hypothetical protein
VSGPAGEDVGVLRVRGRRTGLLREVRLRYHASADGLTIAAGGWAERWPVEPHPSSSRSSHRTPPSSDRPSAATSRMTAACSSQ